MAPAEPFHLEVIVTDPRNPGLDEFTERVHDALADGFGEPHYAALRMTAMDLVKANPVLLPMMMLLVVVLDRMKSLEEESEDRWHERLAKMEAEANITPEKRAWMHQTMLRIKQEYQTKFPVAP
jgi:hypothetical protein